MTTNQVSDAMVSAGAKAFCETQSLNPHKLAEAVIRAALQAKPETEPLVIDLEKSFYAQLVEAAGQSNWIPPHYFTNDWVSDCARFLRTGEGVSR